MKLETGVAQDQLSPEVAQILLAPKVLDLEMLKQDGYTGLLAIDAPEGMDYMQIGSQVIQCQFESHQKAIAAHDSSVVQACKEVKDYYDGQPPLQVNTVINGTPMAFPCKTLNDNTCVAKTLELKQGYLTLFNENAVLLERYRAIEQQPYYNSYYYDVNSWAPLFQYRNKLVEFRLVQAIFAFDEGNADAGFQLLSEELAFAKRMLMQDTTLIGKMIPISSLYTIYHTIGTLLDTPQMQPYMQDERLLALLALPTAQEQTAVFNLENERNFILASIYTLSQESLDFIVNPPPKIEGIFDEELASSYYEALADSGMTADEFFRTHYDRYVTAHCALVDWQAISRQTSLSMEELSALYTNCQLSPMFEMFDENQENTLCGTRANNSQSNLIGVILRKRNERAFVQFDDYLRRIYDALIYPYLLNVKHQIITAKLNSNEVNAFLQNAGSAAQHPITRKTFTWDEKTQTLSTSWVADYPPAGARGDGDYETMQEMSVYISLP